MTKNGPLSSVNFAPVIFSEMTSRIRDMQTQLYSLMSSFKFVSCVLTIIMQVKSESEKKVKYQQVKSQCFIFSIYNMIIIFVSLLQTPLQRTRTLTAFYVTILPFCFFAKYAERKYFQDPLDKHLNKSKLFGGRKLYPDTWTGALW